MRETIAFILLAGVAWGLGLVGSVSMLAAAFTLGSSRTLGEKLLWRGTGLVMAAAAGVAVAAVLT